MAGAKARSKKSDALRVVAVTGTSEFLGRQLVQRLEADAATRKVLVIDVRESLAYGRKIVFCPVDLTVPEAGHELAELFQEHGVDILAHLAFLSHPIHDTSYAHELQVIGTMHALNAAAAARLKKVVMVGSTMVYGARPDNPNFLTEDHPLRGMQACPVINDLVEAERQLEQFAKKHPRVITTVLRMGSILGAQADGLMARLLSRSIVPTVMGYDPLVQFLHESDAVDALEQAVNQDHPGPFNIVAEGVLPLSTALRLSGRLCVPVPHCLWEKLGGFLWAFQAMDMPVSFVDYLRYLWVAEGTRAREKMGFVPVHTTRQALQEFVRLGQLRQTPKLSAK